MKKWKKFNFVSINNAFVQISVKFCRNPLIFPVKIASQSIFRNPESGFRNFFLARLNVAHFSNLKKSHYFFAQMEYFEGMRK